MNRAITSLALAAFILLAAGSASAQTAGWTEYRPASTLFTTAYQMSQPIGTFDNYAGASFRGFTFDWRSMLAKVFSAGLRFDWNRYNETLSEGTVMTDTGGTLTGPVFRYADQFALEALGHYYINTGPNGLLLPFVGVGVGGVWSNTYQQTIDLGSSQDGFFFIASPEAGVIINFARGGTTVALHLAVSYNFTTASFRDVDNAQSITETMGLTFSY